MKHKVATNEVVARALPALTTYRLPNNSIPFSYDLTLNTDIDKGNFTFIGVVKIQIKIIEGSTAITLHYRQTTIDFLIC